MPDRGFPRWGHQPLGLGQILHENEIKIGLRGREDNAYFSELMWNTETNPVFLYEELLTEILIDREA